MMRRTSRCETFGTMKTFRRATTSQHMQRITVKSQKIVKCYCKHIQAFNVIAIRTAMARTFFADYYGLDVSLHF